MNRYAVSFTDGKHGDEGILVECDAANKTDARSAAYVALLAELEQIEAENQIKLNLDTLRVEHVEPVSL